MREGIGAETVDKLVGKDSLLKVERLFPLDIAGGVPLIALGLLVEPAQIGGLDGVGTLPQGIESGWNQIECRRSHRDVSLPNGWYSRSVADCPSIANRKTDRPQCS